MSTVGSGGAAAGAPDLAGRRLGPYVLRSQLGRGGMGAVYLAEQSEPIRREVAVKLILPGMDTEEILRRFAGERQTLAMMKHPNVAGVLDAGAAEDGRPYFVMEYVRGQPITAHCDEHKLGIAERLRLFIQVCEGVQHAHQKGVIHRDLKPSNVLVEQVDGAARPKIIDFGVAKAIGPLDVDQTRMTRDGYMVGTPVYMSPEQADPGQRDIDTRSDIYSLGLLLYELLSGALPFDREHTRDPVLLNRLIREVVPPTPSTRLARLASTQGAAAADRARQRDSDVRTLTRRLRGDLDWIAMKCLEKDRARRYASAGELAADVERHLRSQPVSAGRPSSLYRLRKFVRRHRVPVAFGVVLLAVLSVGGWFLVRSRLDASHLRQQAAELRAMIAVVTGSTDPAFARTQDTTLMKGVLDNVADQVSRMTGATAETEHELRSLIGTAYLNISEFDKATVHLTRAHELALSEFGPRDERTLASGLDLATVHFRTRRLNEAESLYLSTVETCRETVGDDSMLMANLLGGLAMLCRATGRNEQAVELSERSLNIIQAHHGPTDHLTLAAQENLGQAYAAASRVEEAEKLLVRTLAAKRESLGNDHPSTLISIAGLAEFYRSLKRYDESEQLYLEALAGEERVFGPQHNETLITKGNLGILYITMERLADAEPFVMAAYEHKRKTLGPDHQETLTSLNALGALQLRQAKLDQADTTYAELITRVRRGEPVNQLLLGVALGNHGRVLVGLERHDEAERMLLEAYDLLHTMSGPAPSFAQKAAAALAELYEKTGRAEQAEAWRQKAGA